MKDKQYMLVDKDTGEVIGEANLAKKESKPKERRPFMTLLSWVAMVACGTLFYYAAALFYRLVFWGIAALSNESAALRIIVIVLVGSTLLGVLGYGIIIGASMTVMVSSKVRKSQKGTRFIVFAVIYSLLYAAMIGLTVIGIMRGTPTNLHIYAICGTMIAYCVVVAIAGKNEMQEEQKDKS